MVCFIFSSPKLYAAAIFNTPFSEAPLQYPFLITAILKSDSALYSREMARLLDGPAIDFIRAVYFITDSGDTIFNLMAKAKPHHDFFYSELKNLHHFLFPKEFIFLENISLGGIKMPKPDYLEITAIGKAVLKQDMPAILNESNKLQEGSTIQLFQILHGRTRANDSYISFVKRNLSTSQLMVVWDQALFTAEIKKYIGENRLSLFSANHLNEILSLHAKTHAAFMAKKNKETKDPIGWEFFGIFSAFYGISLVSEVYPSLIVSLHPEKIHWEQASEAPFLILAGIIEWGVYSGIGNIVIQKCRQVFAKKKSKASGA